MHKKKLILLIGGIIAVALICFVLVGLISGAWPWQRNDIGKDYTGMTTTSGTEDPAGDTQDETASGTEDPTETTSDVTENETGSSNIGNNGGTGSNTGTNTQGPSTDAQGPTEENKSNNVITIDDLLNAANKGKG